MIGKNQVLEHKPTGSRWRVLDMDKSSNTVWLFNLEDAKAVPKGILADLIQDANEFVEVERPRSVATLKLSDAAKRRRDAAYAQIEPLIATSDIYDPTKRSAMVQARAAELKCSPQTIYKHLRSWWLNGQNPQALTPHFDRSGNVAGTTGGRGRPSKYGTPTYQITPADQALIQDIVKSMYLVNALVTLEDTYQALLERHYSYVDAEGRLILKLPGERPSPAQFRRHARKHLPTELVIRSRKGNTEFELNHREVLGSLRHTTFTVGDVYEIDSTVVDFFLVHHDNRAKIIGKPCLYMIRDRKSNLVIGFYVGLEEASWLAALQAILSIAEDKRTLCNRYGVSYSPEDWPAHGVMPKEFLGDRGPEMLGNESTKIADGLDLIITNLPKGRGDWKPHVECGFKQTQRALRGVIPGYVPPEDFGKRQRRDYSQDAQHTLSEFRKIILEIIIKHNKSPMPSYPLAPQYVLQDMQPTPTNIWNTEIHDRAGLLSTYTEEEVRLALLPKTEVAVTREGIQLGECFYGAQEAIDYGWFVAAGHSRFAVGDEQYLIPASVFIQAMMRPLHKMHHFLFKPQGLEIFCTPILDDEIPKLGLNLSMRELFAGHNKLPIWFSETYSWMSCFPSANNMWASVYQSAIGGRLDIILPKSAVTMTMTSTKHRDVHLVTHILIWNLAASEEPFAFAANHSKNIDFFQHAKSSRPPKPPHETDGSACKNIWKLSNEEWRAISTLVTQRKGVKHDMREIIDLILYKHGSGCPWRQLPFGNLNFPIVQNTYHRLTKNGNWAKASERLNTIRAGHIGATSDTDLRNSKP